MYNLSKYLLLAAIVLFSFSSHAKTSLTVMSYNIMQLPFQDWDQTARLQNTANTIRQLSVNPDVLIINEAFTDDAYQTLTHSLADIYPYATPIVGQHCSTDHSNWQTIQGRCSNSPFIIRGGTFILSRYPILEQHAYVFTHYSKLFEAADYFSNKGAVLIKVAQNGKPRYIVGTHLQASYKKYVEKAHTIRMQQFSEINSWLKQFKISPTHPVVLAGDFNVEYNNTPKKHLEMIDHCQCTINYSFNGGSFSAATNWVAKAGAYYDGYDLNYDDTLDYVAYHQHYQQPIQYYMEIIKAKADTKWYWHYLAGKWNDQLYHDGYYSDISDHYPAVGYFYFD